MSAASKKDLPFFFLMLSGVALVLSQSVGTGAGGMAEGTQRGFVQKAMVHNPSVCDNKRVYQDHVGPETTLPLPSSL